MPVTVQEQRTRISPCAQGAPSAAGGERARAVSTEGGARGPGGVGAVRGDRSLPREEQGDGEPSPRAGAARSTSK